MDPQDAAPDHDPPPVMPQAPDDGACCGSGCDPCVFDLYEAERERYFVAMRAWRARHPSAT
jgi:hypothetical protein